MKTPVTTLFTLLFGMLAGVCAQEEFDLDEDALFGDTATIVDSKAFTDSGSVVDEREQKSISFSGGITASATGVLHRIFFDEASVSNTSFIGTTFGSFNLDVRLPRSVKSFVDVECVYLAPADSLQFALNELFVDWNIGYRAFFRAGKQVLQWGRGYFFNPVDLVNVEKTRFFDEPGSREGAFGLKAHVPFGTTANLYAFVDMGSVARVDSLALAAKAEVLVTSVELAVSAWGKPGVDPVFGFDFSTSLVEFMVSGEVALHKSLQTIDSVQWIGLMPVAPAWDTVTWAPRVSLGLGRYFDFGDINDRILLKAEGYYNHAGNEDDDFGSFITEAMLEGADGSGFSDESVSGILEPNTFSKWYVAVFGTVSRFILSDMTLTANALVNLNQRCAMLSGGLNYTTLHNLSFDLIVSGFPGPDLTEYTIGGQGLTVEVRTGIRF